MSAADLVKDPITKILIQHDERIRALETWQKITVTVGTLGLTVLTTILVVLLTRV